MAWTERLFLAAAVLVAIGVLVKPVLWVRRTSLGVERFLSDWNGEPARPGHRAKPGFPQRVADLETKVAEVAAELQPNGGGTLRDAVDRIPTQKGTT